MQCMAGDDADKYIHVRCSKDLKKRIDHAAVETDRSLSEYVRETLSEAAEEDLEGVIIDA